MSKITAENVGVTFRLNSSKGRYSVLKQLIGMRGESEAFDALQDISFTIESGDRVAILGKNGAGKSTLLNVLAGLLPPTRGRVTNEGELFPALNANAGLVKKASGYQNITLRGLSHGLRGDGLNEYVAKVSEHSGLGKFLNTPVAKLSAGMRSRLVVSSYFGLQSDILLMDEWIGVADKSVAEKNNGLLAQLVENSNIFILASHRDALIKRHCNKGLVLDAGKLRFFGDISEAMKLKDKLD